MLLTESYPAREPSQGSPRLSSPAPAGGEAWRNEVVETTPFERWLLFFGIVLLPLQDHLPAVGGFSVMFIVFAFIGLYAALFRIKFLVRTAAQPIFGILYLLLAVALVMELTQTPSSLFEFRRLGLMVFGAIILASLCRDRRALQLGIYSFIISGLLMAFNLLLTVYEPLRLIQVSSYAEASQLQAQASQEDLLRMDMNKMALVIAQGAVVALVLALAKKGRWWLLLFTIVSAVGVTLTMSRGGLVILILTTLYILTLKGRIRRRTFGVLLVSLLVLSYLVPDTALKRIEFTDWNFLADPHPSGRAKIYQAAVEHFPDYALYGVGSGNFWGPWGMGSWFRKGTAVQGTHSYFLQVWVYWGLLAELVLVWALFKVRKLLPRTDDEDGVKIGLRAIAVSTFLYMFFSHVLSDKSFSITLGLLVGSSLWVFRSPEPAPRLGR